MYFSNLRRGKLYLIHFHNALKKGDMVGFFDSIGLNDDNMPVFYFNVERDSRNALIEVLTNEVSRLTYVKEEDEPEEPVGQPIPPATPQQHNDLRDTFASMARDNNGRGYDFNALRAQYARLTKTNLTHAHAAVQYAHDHGWLVNDAGAHGYVIRVK